MSRQIDADYDAIRALAERLGGVRDELRNRTAVAGADAAELGSQVVADALDDFLGHWSTGVGRLTDSMDRATSHLLVAARDYQETDDAVAAATGPGKSAG